MELRQPSLQSHPSRRAVTMFLKQRVKGASLRSLISDPKEKMLFRKDLKGIFSHVERKKTGVAGDQTRNQREIVRLLRQLFVPGLPRKSKVHN